MQPPFNISLYPGTGTVDGKRGDHVLIAPAFNVTEEDVRYIADTTADVITQFFRLWVQRGAAKGDDGGAEQVRNGVDHTS